MKELLSYEENKLAKEILRERENVIHVAKPNLIVFLFELIVIVLLVILAILLKPFIASLGFLAPLNSELILCVPILVMGIGLIAKVISVPRAFYILTDERIIIFKGFSDYILHSISFCKIINITLEKSSSDKIFNTGSIKIDLIEPGCFNDKEKTELYWRHIKNPLDVFKTISRYQK